MQNALENRWLFSLFRKLGGYLAMSRGRRDCQPNGGLARLENCVALSVSGQRQGFRLKPQTDLPDTRQQGL
jgi:hypothetical protein